jgi:toxin ParE1/3/4
MRAAIRDLREARAYIAMDDPTAAAEVVARLQRSIELIAQRPQVGRPTSDASVREWSIPGLPYVVPYRLTSDTVEIIRIYHTSRLRPSNWQ